MMPAPRRVNPVTFNHPNGHKTHAGAKHGFWFRLFRWLGRVLSVMLVAVCAQALPEFNPVPSLRLKDEGAARGIVGVLDCVGSGVSCTSVGANGTLTVSGADPAVGIATAALSASTSSLSIAISTRPYGNGQIDHLAVWRGTHQVLSSPLYIDDGVNAHIIGQTSTDFGGEVHVKAGSATAAGGIGGGIISEAGDSSGANGEGGSNHIHGGNFVGSGDGLGGPIVLAPGTGSQPIYDGVIQIMHGPIEKYRIGFGSMTVSGNTLDPDSTLWVAGTGRFDKRVKLSSVSASGSATFLSSITVIGPVLLSSNVVIGFPGPACSTCTFQVSGNAAVTQDLEARGLYVSSGLAVGGSTFTFNSGAFLTISTGATLSVYGVVQDFAYRIVVASSEPAHSPSIASTSYIYLATMTVTMKGGRPYKADYTFFTNNTAGSARVYTAQMYVDGAVRSASKTMTSPDLVSLSFPMSDLNSAGLSAGSHTFSIAVKSDNTGTQTASNIRLYLVEY